MMRERESETGTLSPRRYSVGLYYELLAASYTLPPLGLVYAYCMSHRSRSTMILAVIATIAVVLLLGLAAVIPKGSAA